MDSQLDLLVIGGGFAGLSAAVEAAARGLKVAVLERKPALGGRAYSFRDEQDGDWVDNGQHVLMGCYRETLAFLKQIETHDRLFFLEDLAIQMIKPGGATAILKTAPLPGPFHMTAAVLRYNHLSARDRASLLVAGVRLLAMRRFARAELESITVEQLMRRLGQSDAACSNFWYPLAIATLNEEPALASAALLAEVLKRAFFSRRRDSAFIYSKVGLSDLYCPASVKFIEQRHGAVHTHCGVERLEVGRDGAISAAHLRDGRSLSARQYVSAVPFEPLLAMLPEGVRDEPFFARIRGLTTSPIICAHIWFDRDVCDAAFAGFIGTATQWLFNKRRIFSNDENRGRGYLSFVISGARQLVDQSNQELLRRVLDDLRTMIPASRDARVLKSLVIKEKQATMAPNTRSHQLRPGIATPLSNLLLAGDWVQTGLPATIESAVMTGRSAAAEAARRLASAG